jgi:hypothetical protein
MMKERIFPPMAFGWGSGSPIPRRRIYRIDMKKNFSPKSFNDQRIG